MAVNNYRQSGGGGFPARLHRAGGLQPPERDPPAAHRLGDRPRRDRPGPVRLGRLAAGLRRRPDHHHLTRSVCGCAPVASGAPWASTPASASSSASRAARGRASPPSRGRWASGSRREGYAVRLTFEPGDTAVGRSCAGSCSAPRPASCPTAPRSLLYAADKAEHVDTVVQPALDRGEVVITDRYVDSMLAYQGAGRAARRSPRSSTSPAGPPTTCGPHLTVVLDLEPAPRPRPVRRARPDRGRVAWTSTSGCAQAFLDAGRRRPRPLPRARRPAAAVDEIAAAVAATGVERRCLGQATTHDGLGRPGRPAPRDRGPAGGGGRPRDEPRLAVHRAARLRAAPTPPSPSPRRCSASRPPAAACATRATPCWPAPTPTSPSSAPRSSRSASTRSATWSAAPRWRRSAGAGRS